jgi:hypothetical protein
MVSFSNYYKSLPMDYRGIQTQLTMLENKPTLAEMPKLIGNWHSKNVTKNDETKMLMLLKDF